MTTVTWLVKLLNPLFGFLNVYNLTSVLFILIWLLITTIWFLQHYSPSLITVICFTNIVTAIWLLPSDYRCWTPSISLTLDYLPCWCSSVLLTAAVTFDLHGWSERHSERRGLWQITQKQSEKKTLFTWNRSWCDLEVEKHTEEVQFHNKSHYISAGTRETETYNYIFNMQIKVLIEPPTATIWTQNSTSCNLITVT